MNHKKSQTTTYHSYCLICKKSHEPKSDCNKAMSQFVKSQITGIFEIADKEQKQKLLYILHESRLKLLDEIHRKLPSLVYDYIDGNVEIPVTPSSNSS